MTNSKGSYAKRNRFPNGFTLIEVLIALVVLAIALPAILKATSDSIHSTSYLRDKTLAHWVALDVIAGLQLGLIAVPDTAGLQGTTKEFNKDYYWHLQADEDNEDPYALRVVVEVRAKPEGRILDRQLGFLRMQPDNT